MIFSVTYYLKLRNAISIKGDLAQWVSMVFFEAMTLVNITQGFFATWIWPFTHLAMDDQMGPSEVSVNAATKVNKEEVGDEHVEEVFGGRIIETQEGVTQYIVALRDDKEDTMQGVEPRDGGGGRYQWGIRISQ